MLKIKEKLRPFSHVPGTRCLIPGTNKVVQAYPTKLLLDGKEYPLDGPVKQFTLCQDVERRCCVVFSEKYRLYIWPNGEVKKQKPPIVFQERLFLGCTKKMEWEMMKRRCDMCEIFPLWFQLGQMEAKGSFSLLDECAQKRDVASFTKLFRVGFGSMMVPRRKDEDFLGLCEDEVQGDPAILLSEGFRIIRSLFLDGNQVLPHLPPEFPSGKLLTETIDLEWTKKQIRRVFVRSKTEPKLQFPKKIKRYRVTKKGEMLYLLDRFEK